MQPSHPSSFFHYLAGNTRLRQIDSLLHQVHWYSTKTFSKDLCDSTAMIPAINMNAPEIAQLGGAVPHEEFCTLCGMPFWAYMELNHHDAENDLSWLGYHLARK